VRDRVDLAFEDLGEQEVKNIDRPVRVWRCASVPAAPTADPPNLSNLAAPRDKPSIAVLAFNNMSGDPEQEHFSDGIAEDIITGLSHMKDLLVIARNSSFTYKGQPVEVKRVGEELGVRYVLEGSVRRGGDRVRVTAQLIDTQTGGHVWADRYDGTLDDIFELQDDITAKVLSAVGPEITLAEIQRARSERSQSLDAWDRYLRALPPFYAMDRAGYEEVKALLGEAIEIDPKFAAAHATLARCYVHAGLHGWGISAREDIAKAEEFARKAIAFDEQEPLGHLALGLVHIFRTEPGRAVNELNRALELRPNLTIAYGYLSQAYGFAGRPEEALAAAERAQRGSPRDPERVMWFIGIMNAHFAAERYEEAVEAAEQAVLLQPNLYGGYAGLAYSLPHLGRIEEAREAVRNLHRVMPRMTLKSTARNPMFAREKDVARMLEALRLAGLPE
jgi:adenylate cyclase